MRINTKIDYISIGSGKLKINLLKSSLIHHITYERKMINQLRMTDSDDMLANIYLRLKNEDQYVWKKVIGESLCHYSDNKIIYTGVFEDLHYQVQIDIINDMWFIDVLIKGDSRDSLVDVFLFQDIGIKDGGAIRNNEAYNSQYIDHKVFETDDSFVICSLQNQGNKEYLQIGALTPTKGYATDGYQFFGLDYKATQIPKAMEEEKLPNSIYQYEFAAAVLQSESSLVHATLDHHSVFYGLFVSHHPGAIQKLEFRELVNETYNQLNHHSIDNLKELMKIENLRFNQVYTSPLLNQEEIEYLFPIRHFEEFEDGQLLSFFNDQHEHIVLQSKESYVERAHGHIVLSGQNHTIKEGVLASTNYIYGVFNSQIVLGNTSFSKLISNTRNGLNVQKTHGQRIFIKLKNRYQLLGLPAVYEMGFNYSKWLYKIEDDMLEIISFTLIDHSELNLEIISHQGNHYEFLITSHIVMGSDEYANDFHVSTDEFGVNITPDSDAFICTQYPNIKYRLNLVKGFIGIPNQDHDLQHIFEGSLLKINAHGSHIILNIQGSLNELEKPIISNFIDERMKFITYYNDLINQFHLSIKKNHLRSIEVMKLNTTMYWYAHNALIHFSSPHGLEQFGGAAWGTRDVCQGPFEFFMALNKYSEAKEILKTVYTHQFEQNGDWPQWFMFDKFYKIQAKEAHGDIIVWPLRSLALYLIATNDFDLLNIELPYTSLDTAQYTENKSTVLNHMIKAIDHIKHHYIPNTHLSSYGDGDWDDTLQPANSALRSSMVSGWTTALTYETFMLLSHVLKSNHPKMSIDLLNQAEQIKSDYMKYVMKDNVPAGFLFFGENKSIKHIIHPTDQETHMKYRLLPMNRGIISQLFDIKQSNHLYQIIKENLYHPDGVRLMNTTVQYNGGENTYFKRAETSANFGREIGLQYVHAHIRFVEAMAKLGKKEEAWIGLQRINPIRLKDIVSNAMHRQSNTYFSSSDANFLNRYEAMKNFNQLFTGSVGVKGGWRIYSSGPGIYINQLISNVLGLRKEGNKLIIDPQIPDDFDGLEFKFVFKEKRITLKYHLKGLDREVRLNNENIIYSIQDDIYRQGAIHIPLDHFHEDKEYILEYFG